MLQDLHTVVQETGVAAGLTESMVQGGRPKPQMELALHGFDRRDMAVVAVRSSLPKAGRYRKLSA
jgi:hypothetical protein